MALSPRLFVLRPFILRLSGALRWLPPTVARLTVGWVFVLSGWGKLHDLPTVIDYFRTLGIPAPGLQAPFASGVEFTCGCLILLGLFTRVASVPLIVVMTVAIATARKGDLTSLGALFGFIEWLYIALLLYLGAEGAGPLSLDAIVVRLGGEAAGPATRA